MVRRLLFKQNEIFQFYALKVPYFYLMLANEVHESVAQCLKHRTEKNHRELEELLLPILSAVKTLDDYKALLKAFYGYFKPLEAAISRHVTERVLPDIEQRRKADYLLKDLSTLQNPQTTLPLAADIPAITTVYEAMGALYVLEGSTLGGKGITRMLLKNTQVGLQAHQVRFFNSYGEAVGKMWNAFVQVLNGLTSNGNDIEAMVNKADETFLLFKNWLQKQLVHG